MSEMKLIMESWRGYQNEAEIKNLIVEINQLSKEIIDYTSLLTEQQLLSEEFLRKAAAWFGKKWKQLSGLFDQLYEKSKTLFAKMGSIRKKTGDAYIGSMAKIYLALQKLLPKKSRNAFQEVLSAYSEAIYDLCEEELGEAWQGRIKKAVEEALNESLSGLKTQVPQDKGEQKEYLEQNAEQIAQTIRETVLGHPALKNAKSIIQEKASPEELEKAFAARLKSRGLNLEMVKGFAIGSSFMFTFGVIDNVGLFVGMAAVEDTLVQMGFDSMIAAGFGNTLSDALGVVLGGLVMLSLKKILDVKGEGTIAQQFVGVVAGCLVPVAIKMTWMWLVTKGYLPPD
tara:strand:+ start:1813 stop:2835 length:1023 start_codon:yes stop_codon:yes gene_type:complete